MDGDIPCAPSCSPGGDFGLDTDLPRVLEAANNPKVTNLELAIDHVASLIPHLPIDSTNIPSLAELSLLIDQVKDINTCEALNQHSLKYWKREELVHQLVGATLYVNGHGQAMLS